MCGMKDITTSCFSFEDVIKDGNVYVGKTDLLAKLVKKNHGQYFISRPRRFGKSLMLSTLQCMFEGRKELFKGLKISTTNYKWETYPVLHLDMMDAAGESLAAVTDGLNAIALSAARSLGIEIEKNDSPAQTFRALWDIVKERKLQVVVLVDEYDSPLQGFLDDPGNLKRVRKLMHDFYVKLKSYSRNIRFMMMTGVSKFAKLSVFSGLNNPVDLTMSKTYAGLLGYTHDELKEFFSQHIKAFARSEKKTPDMVFNQLLEWYDNYRFSPKGKTRVLNPVSVGSALANQEFDSYWNATGAPSLVMEALRKADKWPTDLDHVDVMKIDLDVCDAETLPVTPLLYQSGYLTIKDASGDLLTLGMPNKEVRCAIVRGHIASLVNQNNASEFNVRSVKAMRALQAGKLDDAIEIFRSAVAGLPYEWLIKDEGAVKIAFLDFFHAMDNTHVNADRIDAERETANGRIDAIVETKDYVYIFEFKYNETAQAAFDQIVENGYHLPYRRKPIQSTTQLSTRNSQHSGCKPVIGIGLNFNPEKGNRGIEDPIVKVISC